MNLNEIQCNARSLIDLFFEDFEKSIDKFKSGECLHSDVCDEYLKLSSVVLAYSYLRILPFSEIEDYRSRYNLMFENIR